MHLFARAASRISASDSFGLRSTLTPGPSPLEVRGEELAFVALRRDRRLEAIDSATEVAPLIAAATPAKISASKK